MIAVVGTYTSTETLTVAPLFMPDLIPMVNLQAGLNPVNIYFLLDKCLICFKLYT